MKRIYFICIAVIILGCQTITAQEVKSVKTGLRINNIPKVEVVEIPDTEPPVVEFISPMIYLGTRFYTQQQELDLIGKVTDSSGISLVMINGVSHLPTESGIFTTRLNLNRGDNRVRIVAMDEKDNLRDVFFIVDYTPPVVTLADRISSEAIYYGLIIGIDQYVDDDIPNLDNPVKDARKLYQTLNKKYNFQEENITFIENATRAQIIQSLDSLSEVISEADNLLIFYAGHGTWNAESNNGFWLPSDAHPFMKTNWFRNSTLVDYLKEIKSHHTLLITDACFAGSIFAMRSAFGNKEKAYEKLYELPSRKAMTSGQKTMVPDRSSFARFLIERLEENTETYLSAEQLFSSFRLAVINNSDAIPEYGEIEKVGDEGGDFIFLKK
jgi:hypothetical protein